MNFTFYLFLRITPYLKGVNEIFMDTWTSIG